MDSKQTFDGGSGGGGGYTPSYSSSDPAMNVPITSKQSLSSLSPYLNVDPYYLPDKPEFIFPEGSSRQRGRFELAFSQIGGSAIVGATVGGVRGLYSGIQDTTLAGHRGHLQRTQLLNYTMKQGAATANMLGVIAVMYSGFGVILSWARGTDDEINTLSSATITGLLYRSSAGVRKCLMGGGVGLGLAAAYCLISSRDRFRQVGQYA